MIESRRVSLKIIPVLGILIMSSCGRKEPGNETACPHDPGFDRSKLVRVRAAIPPAVLRRDLSLSALAAQSGGLVGAGKLQGLTAVDHQLAFQSLVNAETARGKTCVWFEEVRIDMTPASLQIFVPSEYSENSCEYLAILAHEREHERVHAERLAAAAGEIETALTAARWLPARGNPLETDDRIAAETALKAKIAKVVTPAYDKFKTDLAVAQDDLDRPDLYQWVSKRCSGWK